jgi:hypothetical protein
MKQRCLNSRHKEFPRYGGRGISVCQKWIDSFEAFFTYIGPRPGPGYSLDREDNDGNYEPGNVRWATAFEQTHNRRANKKKLPRYAECHPDQLHVSQGLCNACYLRQWREQRKSDKQARRADCHPNELHLARGLCNKCYKEWRKRG